MKSTLLHLAKTSLVKNCSASMFSNAQRPMSTFALPIASEKTQIGSVLEVVGKHALRLSHDQIERFFEGDNIFPNRRDTYLIFESENKAEEVEGLNNIFSWKEPYIKVKPVGTTKGGEVAIFSYPSPS